MPVKGFIWIDNDLAVDSCMASADSLWLKQSGNEHDLLVAAYGPHGSGRYWRITVAVKEKDQTRPIKGLCLETSTIGWRTLQSFKKLPLPWVTDQNADGRPEFVLWDSFPLNDEPTMSEFGLIGWVYELNPGGSLDLNLDLTRILASEIASAYRVPIRDTDAGFQQRREKIAQILDEFVKE
jgi:hypothetical protein